MSEREMDSGEDAAGARAQHSISLPTAAQSRAQHTKCKQANERRTPSRRRCLFTARANSFRRYLLRVSILHLFVILFIQQLPRQHQQANLFYSATAQQQTTTTSAANAPAPVASASHVALDGLALVVIFQRPLNLSASIESVEQRQASAAAAASIHESESRLRVATASVPYGHERRPNSTNAAQQVAGPKSSSHFTAGRHSGHRLASASSEVSFLASRSSKSQQQQQQQCPTRRQDDDDDKQQETPHLIGGVQLCAQLLSRKTLRMLHRHKLYNCLWASQVQFLVQVGKPFLGGGASVRLAFRRHTLVDLATGERNPQELALELGKLPLEGLGVPLAPRLALTGPNQVPPCGQFSLSAHLSSPYGTAPEQSVRLRWSVERRGMMPTSSSSSGSPVNSSQASSPQQTAAAVTAQVSQELAELQWQALRQLVAQERTNHLVLEARLLQFVPQLYEFRLEATFTSGAPSSPSSATTATTTFNLNASHQLGRLDFDTPIGTIYGSHLLALDTQLNTHQELALLADVQVPECAANIKQVGLYWQVSDPRVRFEQTYAPFYLAKSGALPEQALLEFRLNLFYGIRVKKFASAGTLVATGESLLEAQISDGLLMASVAQPSHHQSTDSHQQQDSSSATSGQQQQLELFAVSREKGARGSGEQDKFAYQWSCFDGKTAQPCAKSLKLQASSGGTRYDLGAPAHSSKALLLARPGGEAAGSGGGSNLINSNDQQQQQQLLLVDRSRQRQPTLRLPLSWLEADAQLWFGLQRFDRGQPSQHSKTEYALVSVHPVSGNSNASPSPLVVSVGPVLVGRGRHRATIRNPLTGAIVLVAGAPAVVVGRLSPAGSGAQFAWHSPNYPHPLHWTTRNVTNPLNGQQEILTELHLDQELLVAHAHHQVQLSVCGGGWGGTASVSLDVVQGVAQCRVEMLTSRGGGTAGTSSTAATQQVVTGAQGQQEQLPLVVTVNYCNIPLGLSPITYQLYILDTSASDGFVAATGGGGAPRAAPAQPEEEDYMNEADEQFYAAQAQPLSVPQLSPVFPLGALSARALAGLANTNTAAGGGDSTGSATSTRLRFAARVCDRLASCQMFYSSALDPLALVARATSPHPDTPTSAAAANLTAAGGELAAPVVRPGQAQRLQSLPLTTDEHADGQAATLRALRQMLEAAKRANTAGNSIAAISLVNAVMQLAQRQLTASGLHDGGTRDAPAQPGERSKPRPRASSVRYSGEPDSAGDGDDHLADGANVVASGGDRWRAPSLPNGGIDGDKQSNSLRGQLRELLLVAMRDCIHYGTRSVQRHFHFYTESGQTNLVVSALARLLASQQAHFELKFRALRLLVLLVRKTLEQQPVPGVGASAEGADGDSMARLAAGAATRSAPDLRTLQAAYESLFAPLAQHTIHSQAALLAGASGGGAAAADQRADKSPAHLGVPHQRRDNNNNNSGGGGGGGDLSEAASGGAVQDELLASAAAHSHNQHQQQQVSLLKASSRRGKEEAILALLKLTRAAHRALLASAASQLALGSVHSFEFQSPGVSASVGAGPGVGQQQQTAPPQLQLPLIGTTNNFVEANKFLASEQPAALIVSSMAHQTELPTGAGDEPIELELRDFGQVSVRYGARLGAKLARQMRQARLRCRGATTTTTKGAQNDTRDPARCSSFVLALSAFAGKAPFRALDSGASEGQVPEGPSRLRVPILQVDWLSPQDGSSLLDWLARHDERGGRHNSQTADSQDLDHLLTLEDFRASATFALPTASLGSRRPDAISASELEPYKCYKFDELAGEWTLVGGAQEETSSSTSGSEGPAATDRPTTTTLRCPFEGYGTLGVFRGRPPSSLDTPTELSIAVGAGLLLAVVAIFSILGCMASKAKRRRRARPTDEGSLGSATPSGSSAGSSVSYASSELEHARHQQQRRPELPRHLAS